jgi:hypothetical protein
MHTLVAAKLTGLLAATACTPSSTQLCFDHLKGSTAGADWTSFINSSAGGVVQDVAVLIGIGVILLGVFTVAKNMLKGAGFKAIGDALVTFLCAGVLFNLDIIGPIFTQCQNIITGILGIF